MAGERSSISAETLRQRVEVEVAQDTDDAQYTEVIAITIRVLEATAKGAAQQANAVSLASQQVLAEQEDATAKRQLAALARRDRELQNQIDAAATGCRCCRSSRPAPPSRYNPNPSGPRPSVDCWGWSWGLG